MPADTNIVHLDSRSDGSISPGMSGSSIMIVVMVGYPGSKVTDLLIGDHIVQVPNDDLREAYELGEKVAEANFDGG